MKNAFLLFACLFATFAFPIHAEPTAAQAAAFKTFFATFQAAARANDHARLVDAIAFPVEVWAVQTKGNEQEQAIKDRATFLAHFDHYFTSDMRAHVVTAKPQPLKDSRYIISWHDTDTEYSFEFSAGPDGAYKVTSYLIGPY